MILFILRDQHGSGGWCGYKSSGLTNSATLVADMLESFGVDAEVITVFDSNSIDKEVSRIRPDIVVLEAIWVPPYKLIELAKLWPGIRWIVRIHSEIPFLANEGIAIDWLFQYARIPNVEVASNSIRGVRDLKDLNPLFLPNFYPIHCLKAFRDRSDYLNIGCFGAIRPLKNQLSQAFAAIAYAEDVGKPLNFFINASRTEQGGDQPLKNIRALFSNYPEDQFRLVEIPWLEWRNFLEIVRDMDVCMSVSFSETFCITAANAVSQNVPVVVSPEIFWASDEIKADPTNIKDIQDKLGVALGRHRKKIVNQNLDNLRIYDDISIEKWLELR